MENYEQLHGQTIAEQNKQLIDSIRKKANKPPANNTWLTVLWVIAMVVLIAGAIIGIWLATRPIKTNNNDNLIISVNGHESNEQELQNLKFPMDTVDYQLSVCNNKQSDVNVYFRFSALTFVEGVLENNILEFVPPTSNINNFFYDEEQDTWYYLGYLEVNEQVKICSKVKLKGNETSNLYAGKSVGFSLIIEAVQASADYVWLNSSEEWLTLMGIK